MAVIWLSTGIVMTGSNVTGAPGPKTVPDEVVIKVIDVLSQKAGQDQAKRIKRGVSQAAKLWQSDDGSAKDFEALCLKYFTPTAKDREILFKRLSRNFEIILGHFNKITLDLQEPVHLDQGDIHPLDPIFSGYSPYAHLSNDFYKNKIAFITVLNFPFYSLEEKTKMGEKWSRQEWAYARLGDFYTARVPASLNQAYSAVSSDSDIYISEYNVFMGHVLSKKGKKLFPKDMRLLSHWNLRDELKANYGQSNGLEKQEILYTLMLDIITQDIPQKVINNPEYDWNPYTDKTYKDGKEVKLEREPDTRYRWLLNNFHALKAMDPYYPAGMDTYIKRNFAGDMEIAQDEVEELFVKFISSPQVKKVAKLIRKRVQRKLKPWDVWYDGFTARSGLSEPKLDKMVAKKYPNAKALENDLENLLLKLGFAKDKAKFLASKIVVDDARGSGHAWGAQMKAEVAHLRTRVPDTGMNYKGYNIAVHEFGHNVEQTISLHDVDDYIMNGVPNTSFTEALAFIFQRRDLDLLGIKETNPNKQHMVTLDTFWSVYESMGVSLVDMRVWKWMYANPSADTAQLKKAVIKISADVWNKYYAPVLGGKDSPILAIYSHMISYPLYLSAYSFGYLIDNQIENYIKDKDFAKEVERMFSAGRLVPQLWMKNAVGSEIDIKPLLNAVDEAVKHIKK